MGMPRLTVRMAATVQGFPPDWQLFGIATADFVELPSPWGDHTIRVILRPDA